ncbi:ABC transporter ATP-binding protein [Candidatus Riflebacteria bacterium]
MAEIVIETKGLTRSFGSGRGVFDIDLQIPRGSIFGLLGRNGAGKTTLIKILLGLLLEDRGEAFIEGLHFHRDNTEILQKIGYVDENRRLYNWMRVNEIIQFNASFFPNWDSDYSSALIAEFNLPENEKIQNLSRGENALVALILALGHHPRILILDEATSGLDVLVRRKFLERLIDFSCKDNTTILFSSHLLDDLERVCDQIAIIEKGKLLLHGSMEDIKKQYCSMTASSPVSHSRLEDIFIQILEKPELVQK